MAINHGVLYHKSFFSKGERTLYQLPKKAKSGPFVIPKGQVAVVANNPVRSFGAKFLTFGDGRPSSRETMFARVFSIQVFPFESFSPQLPFTIFESPA